MGEIQQYLSDDGPWSFTCAEPVVGGQLVERRPGAAPGQGLVGVAAAGSVHSAGVALHDVPAVRSTIQGPQVGDGGELRVGRAGVFPVTFAAAAVEGDKLVVAAGGQVTPAGATPDARTIVGEAWEAAASGATRKALIY